MDVGDEAGDHAVIEGRTVTGPTVAAAGPAEVFARSIRDTPRRLQRIFGAPRTAGPCGRIGGMRTFVLVHGAFCSAASWSPAVRALALRGHRALAVDLPGHGFSAAVPTAPDSPSGIAGTGTADDVAAVTAVVERAAEHGPVVLVGHSRGGLAVTAVANAVPDRLERTVHVAAWCPSAPVAEYAASPEAAGSLLDPLVGRLLAADPAVLGALRVRWQGLDDTLLDGLQAALLTDGTRAELLSYLAAMDADEALAIDDGLVRADPDRWGRVPHTYVRLARDRALPVALQDRFVADADARTAEPFTVHTLDTTHAGVQLHPAGLVDVLTG